jgi:uncharacterized protein YjiS (DUF1127 family)
MFALTWLTSRGLTPRRLLDRLAAIDAEHRLCADLERFDERTLCDVGLSRDDIDAEVRHLARSGSSRRVQTSPATGRVSEEAKGRSETLVQPRCARNAAFATDAAMEQSCARTFPPLR